MTTPAIPQFEVVFKGQSLEPAADVAPAGDVTFVLMNESPEPHDFALVDIGDGPRRPDGRPAREAASGPVASALDVPPGDSSTFTQTLGEGRYALVLNTKGWAGGTSLFLLTVQPAAGA